MANGKEHKVISGTIGGGAAFLYAQGKFQNEYTFLYTVGGVLGGIAGGKLPDIIDRPDTPNHRSFGHSWTLVGCSTLAEKKVTIFRNIFTELQTKATELNSKGDSFGAGCCHLAAAFMIGLVAGYGAHLAADMVTPRRLPLLCKQF